MTQAITLYRREHERDPIFEYVFSMYLMYATRPAKSAPDETGAFDIGEVGDSPDRTFDRWSPYSLATPKVR